MIDSDRLRLRIWRDSDRNAFAALNADPKVTQDLGGPLDRTASDAKFDRYVAAFEQRGFCRWALERLDGQFLGYAGVMPSRPAFDAACRMATMSANCRRNQGSIFVSS